MTAPQRGRGGGGGAVAPAALWVACLAPIVFLPGALDRWFLPKAAALAIACVLGSLSRRNGVLPRWFLFLTGAGAVVLLVAAALSPAPLAEFWGRWPRYEGAVMLPVYWAAVWLGSRLLGPRAPASLFGTLVSAVTVASIALGVVSLLEATGLRPVSSGAARPGSLLGNASDQGLVGVVFLAVLLLPALRAWVPLPRPALATPARPPRPVTLARASTWRRVTLVIGLAAAVFTIVASASRGAAAASIATLAIHAVLEVRRAGGLRLRRGELEGSLDRAAGVSSPSRRERATAFGVSAAVAVIVVAGSFALPATRARFAGTDGLAFASATDRLLIWREALAVVAQRPFLGWGPSGFLDAVSRAHGAQWQRDVGSATTLDSPHNVVLQILAAGGAALLVVAVVALVFAVITIRRNWAHVTGPAEGLPALPADPDRADLLASGIASLAGLAVGLSVTFTTPGIVILPALLFGALLSSRPGAAAAQDEQRSFAAIRSAVLLAWCLFVAVSAAADIPLAAGVTAAAAGDADRAESAFDTTVALRPWDADIASIAAQSFAASADAGHARSAPLAVSWARRALSATPGDLLAGKALAVGQQYTGDLSGAEATLRALAADHRYDSQVAQRLGGILLLEGRPDDATRELARAAQLDPTNVDVWKTLAYAYGQTGDGPGRARAEATIARLGGTAP